MKIPCEVLSWGSSKATGAIPHTHLCPHSPAPLLPLLTSQLHTTDRQNVILFMLLAIKKKATMSRQFLLPLWSLVALVLSRLESRKPHSSSHSSSHQAGGCSKVEVPAWGWRSAAGTQRQITAAKWLGVCSEYGLISLFNIFVIYMFK